MGPFIFLFAFTLAVILHEYGHYVAATRLGIPVISFNIGFGPILLSRTTRSGMLVALRLIPLGGYVTMPRLLRAPRHHQALAMLAGPLANLAGALAYVACMGVWHFYRSGHFPLGDFTGLGLLVLKSPQVLFSWDTVHVTATQGVFVESYRLLTALFSPEDWGRLALVSFFVVNMTLWGLNILPIPPLDGGRLLMLALPRRLRRLVVYYLLPLFILFFIGLEMMGLAQDILRLIGVDTRTLFQSMGPFTGWW